MYLFDWFKSLISRKLCCEWKNENGFFHPCASPDCKNCDGIGVKDSKFCSSCIDIDKVEDCELGVGD